MLITDKIQLQKYVAANRLWQGILSVEITPKGRLATGSVMPLCVSKIPR